MEQDEIVKPPENEDNYITENAKISLKAEDGGLQLESEENAVKKYFLDNVNLNTVFFHNLEEKLNYLIEEDYYEKWILEDYTFEFVKEMFQLAYSYKYRFQTLMAAYKFYETYAMRTRDNTRILERYEDRIVMNALFLGDKDKDLVEHLVKIMMENQYQPATPTFLNAAKKQRGEYISCYEVLVDDDMNSIGRSINSALQLSKRGGGVALGLTDIREEGAPIKGIQNAASGVVPIMKLYEDSFSYANQLGQRQGAGAVYISAHHPDIMKVLDTKRENADEKLRIKTLSLGIVIPDITFELAKKGGEMYLFSPYDVREIYGKPMSQVNITEEYENMVSNPNIRKHKVNVRKFFTTIAEVQGESGYPYIMFDDTVNRDLPVKGKVVMSNLCSEILQPQEHSRINNRQKYEHVGYDVVCNLGSLNVAKTLDDGEHIGDTVRTAVRALNTVNEKAIVDVVPSIEKTQKKRHPIGLGAMNLHGALASNEIMYGSDESIEFVNAYFSTINYWTLVASMEEAIKYGETFQGFLTSTYATGTYFTKYVENDYTPKSRHIKKLFKQKNFTTPTPQDWAQLKEDVAKNGLYNSQRLAIPPTGSISYLSNATPSVWPVVGMIENRKEGKTGRIYVPAYGLTRENYFYYESAYDIDKEKYLNVIASIQTHIDQGISTNLFFRGDNLTTAAITKTHIMAWRKGIKTLYYTRIANAKVIGQESSECVSCLL